MSNSTLDIRVAANAAEARAALADGYEPVECAFGSESVVGSLGLDHHGDLVGCPPVCRQARAHMMDGDSTSALRLGYVVTGPPDADASLAVAFLSGAVDGYGPDAAVLNRIANLVAASDVGHWADLSAEGHAGAIILAWHARQRARGAYPRITPESSVDLRAVAAHRWVLSVQDWAELLALPWGDHDDRCAAHGFGECVHYGCQPTHVELLRAYESEAERVRLARGASLSWEVGCCECGGRFLCSDSSDCPCGQGVSTADCRGVALIESPVMGADVWYAAHPTLRGYVAWQEATKRVSISLRPGTAQIPGLLALTHDGVVSTLVRAGISPRSHEGALIYSIGQGKHDSDWDIDPDSAAWSGLTAVDVPNSEEYGWYRLADHLLPTGWGGQASGEIIASPRGEVMTRDDGVRAARLLAERIDEVAQ